MTQDPVIDGAETLPECLRVRAERFGSLLAFRQKERGLWRSHTWSALEAKVNALVNGLRSHGFLPGDRLLVDAGPVAATFQLSLAAQCLGGAVVACDGDLSRHGAAGLDASAAARFAFAADDAARARLLAARAGGAPFSLGILLDGDDSPEVSDGWLSFDELARTEGADVPLPQVATNATLALTGHASPAAAGATPAVNAGRALRSRNHADLVRDARALIAAAGIAATDEALAWSDLSLSAQLETVLATWLVAGFRLNFVETPATEDADRRELGPSLLFGSTSAFSDLSTRTRASLPPSAGRERRWLDRVLAARSGAGRIARRLIVHRLREVVGFGRLRRAVVLGEATPVAVELERLFGLPLREWPPRPRARLGEPHADAAPALAASSLLGLGTARLGAGSRSDIA